MQEYVICIAENDEHIVYIEKQHPDWQKGKLNFVGGKIEKTDLTIWDTATREFYEETGVYFDGWIYVGLLTKDNIYNCYIMYGNSDLFSKCKTMTDETVFVLSKKNGDYCSQGFKFLSNVKWIYDAITDGENKFLTVNYGEY